MTDDDIAYDDAYGVVGAPTTDDGGIGGDNDNDDVNGDDGAGGGGGGNTAVNGEYVGCFRDSDQDPILDFAYEDENTLTPTVRIGLLLGWTGLGWAGHAWVVALQYYKLSCVVLYCV